MSCGQVAAALGCTEDSILVRYEAFMSRLRMHLLQVQNSEDKDRELALYSMPLGGAVSITMSMAWR